MKIEIERLDLLMGETAWEVNFGKQWAVHRFLIVAIVKAWWRNKNAPVDSRGA